ncbi:hypothetical protein K488DRAFT_54047 [Vararia minispora EC-137]|uniref:Uncharacterized protein n=1 Tax=Vararia minispora EC-137 TaxID=1314806 RepID=A0ACB8QFC8_9AGAM|nr:hypothetical protein K488DRAFT_54047 [Vararia minispora EC-137]
MASSQKRKRADEDSDDEPMYGMRQILPVANLPADFTGEPVDGMQYLFTVRRDATRLPEFTRVPNPYDVPQTPDHALNASINMDGHVNTNSFLPSEDWREAFNCHFRNFRANVTQPTITLQRPSLKRLTPDKMNRDAWWAFFAGAPESVWNPPAKKSASKQIRQRRGKFGNTLDPSDPAVIGAGWELVAPAQPSTYTSSQLTHSPSASVSSPTVVPPPENTSDDIVADGSSNVFGSFPSYRPREPTPMLLQGIDHRFSLHLLMYFSHWIGLHVESFESPGSEEPHVIREVHAKWIFALFSRVDAFCTSDEMSTLRALVRACLSLIRTRHISRTGGDKDSVASTPKLSDQSVWLILGAVAGFWGQRDLWDDAEAVFSKIS